MTGIPEFFTILALVSLIIAIEPQDEWLTSLVQLLLGLLSRASRRVKLSHKR